MKKVIKSKIILGIIIIIAISIVGIKMATKEEMNIKGVNYEKGKIVETDLGKYNKNKKYEGYEAYILSDNSDYNIFKNDKVEVKYPKILKIKNITNEEISLLNNDNKILMSISFIHMNKTYTIKEIAEQAKKTLESNKEALKYSDIKYNVDGNKMFILANGNDNKNGSFSETVINNGEIYGLTIAHSEKEVKNWDEIIKNIKESFKVL
ncbi:hypothetical protein ACV3RS_15195 [Clostridium perfringens]